MKITFKGKKLRVQLAVFDLTNVRPEEEVVFSVQSLPATANLKTSFSTGPIHYHGPDFAQAWRIVCKLLGVREKEVPNVLQKYAKRPG